MKINRFVLCRPQGGLNDVLCQVEKACIYAEKFDRIVIIDTNHHSTTSIKDHFSNYFVSKQMRVILDLTEIESELKNISVFPHFLADDFLQYDAHRDPKLRCYVEKNSRQPITFDFTKDYAETLLIHHASGGWRGSAVAALSRLSLHVKLSDELIKRLNCIGPNYVSIHIRNTDYMTNYQHYLEQIKGHSALLNCKHLFVATDDIACLEYCRNVLTDMKTFSFSKLASESGRPLHRLLEDDDIYERNKDAILDLLMLALSRTLIFFDLNENQWGARHSGYSLLALDLLNSKTILRGLISRPEIDMLLGPTAAEL